MTIRAPYMPQRGANQVVSPGAASASVNVDPHAKTIRLVNVGANICHVRVGAGAQTATTADMPVRANSEVDMQKGDGDDTVAYISAAGTTLHIQPGEGGY
jgi:hypothetical protein